MISTVVDTHVDHVMFCDEGNGAVCEGVRGSGHDPTVVRNSWVTCEGTYHDGYHVI